MMVTVLTLVLQADTGVLEEYAACFSNMSVSTYNTTQCHYPEMLLQQMNTLNT